MGSGLLKSNDLAKSTATVGATAPVATTNQPPTALKRFQFVGADGSSVPINESVTIPQALKNEFAAIVAEKTAIEEQAEAGTNPPTPTNILLTFFLENIKTFRNTLMKLLGF
jgi:hypothetical protein